MGGEVVLIPPNQPCEEGVKKDPEDHSSQASCQAEYPTRPDYISTLLQIENMRFTTASLVSVGLAAVRGLPLTGDTDLVLGCRVDLAPTLSQPQNAASNILYGKPAGFIPPLHFTRCSQIRLCGLQLIFNSFLGTLSKWVSTTKASYFSTVRSSTPANNKEESGTPHTDNPVELPRHPKHHQGPLFCHVQVQHDPRLPV